MHRTNSFDYEKSLRNRVTEILRRHVAEIVEFKEADEEQDTKQATDFVVVAKAKSIAVRVRRPTSTSNASRGKVYRDLTIRTRSAGKGETEIDKLRKGWGDMYLYCWENQSGQLQEYMIVDIHKLRAAGLLDPKEIREIPNGDGTYFYPINLERLRKAGCIILDTVTTTAPNVTTIELSLAPQVTKTL